MTDFRPISVCSMCYKLVSKILANRLKVLMPNLISRDQTGFIQGYTSLDSIIIIREIIHSMNFDSKGPSLMLLKVDIEKAYDNLNWFVILATLARMGFSYNMDFLS